MQLDNSGENKKLEELCIREILQI